MAARNRLIDLLETQGVPYETHASQADRRSPTRLPGECQIQVVFADNRPAMLVVPANAEVDLTAAGRLIGRNIRFADEDELARLFPDCDPGSMPAFGNWYGMPVYIDVSIASQGQMTFPTGMRGEQVTVPTGTVERLTRAVPAPLIDTRPALSASLN
jgi:Ala-tRNA(Pro) deacylase